jgi:hypothetical protein
MGGDIALIVAGGLLSLSAALLEGVRVPDWLRGGRLEPGRVLFQVLITTGFVLPASAALQLTAGHPAWMRCLWTVVALFGSGLLYAAAHRVRERQTL